MRRINPPHIAQLSGGNVHRSGASGAETTVLRLQTPLAACHRVDRRLSPGRPAMIGRARLPAFVGSE
jgi:hypothetical protein